MADVEKVKQGLKLHSDGCGYRSYACDYMECPYRYGDESCDIEELTHDALSVIEELQAEIERLKEKDRLHCEDCAYNGICETPHTDKSPLCAEYSIVR